MHLTFYPFFRVFILKLVPVALPFLCGSFEVIDWEQQDCWIRGLPMKPVGDKCSNIIYLLFTFHLCFWNTFLPLYFTVSNWNLCSTATIPRQPPGWILVFVRKPKPLKTVKMEVEIQKPFIPYLFSLYLFILILFIPSCSSCLDNKSSKILNKP